MERKTTWWLLSSAQPSWAASPELTQVSSYVPIWRILDQETVFLGLPQLPPPVWTSLRSSHLQQVLSLLISSAVTARSRITGLYPDCSISNHIGQIISDGGGAFMFQSREDACLRRKQQISRGGAFLSTEEEPQAPHWLCWNWGAPAPRPSVLSIPGPDGAAGWTVPSSPQLGNLCWPQWLLGYTYNSAVECVFTVPRASLRLPRM